MQLGDSFVNTIPPLAGLGALLVSSRTRAPTGCSVGGNPAAWPAVPPRGGLGAPMGACGQILHLPKTLLFADPGGSGFLPCLTVVGFRWPSALPVNPAAFPSRSPSSDLKHPVFYSHKIALLSNDIPVRSHSAHAQQISCRQIVPCLRPPQTVSVPVTRCARTRVGIRN